VPPAGISSAARRRAADVGVPPPAVSPLMVAKKLASFVGPTGIKSWPGEAQLPENSRNPSS
jgi:hypothetical protein